MICHSLTFANIRSCLQIPFAIFPLDIIKNLTRIIILPSDASTDELYKAWREMLGLNVSIQLQI